MQTTSYPQTSPAVNPMPKSTHTSYPHGYFELAVGTRFIQIDGKALPIQGLTGETRGGFFYPNGGNTGYAVKTRTATQREAYEASRPLPRPVVSCFQPDAALDPFADWK